MFVPIFIFCLFVHQYFIFIKCYCFRRMPFILQSVTNWMIPRSCKTFIIRCICVMCNVYACIYDIQWILDWELFLVVFFLFQICHVKVSLRLSWQWHWTINIVVKSFFLWFFFLSFFCFATLFLLLFQQTYCDTWYSVHLCLPLHHLYVFFSMLSRHPQKCEKAFRFACNILGLYVVGRY